jgi:hypothetical protein
MEINNQYRLPRLFLISLRPIAGRDMSTTSQRPTLDSSSLPADIWIIQ